MSRELIPLFPENYNSTMIGLIAGIILVLIFAFVLRTSVRKVKQAIMKVAVSAILLTFSAFWFMETVTSVNDLYLIPLFLVFFAAIYLVGSRGISSLDTESSTELK